MKVAYQSPLDYAQRQNQQQRWLNHDLCLEEPSCKGVWKYCHQSDSQLSDRVAIRCCRLTLVLFLPSRYNSGLQRPTLSLPHSGNCFSPCSVRFRTRRALSLGSWRPQDTPSQPCLHLRESPLTSLPSCILNVFLVSRPRSCFCSNTS